MVEQRRQAAVNALLDRLRLNPPASPKQAAEVGLAISGIALSDDPEALDRAQDALLRGSY